jgi:hypothetical protein
MKQRELGFNPRVFPPNGMLAGVLDCVACSEGMDAPFM